jgi:hypothetical protein
LGEQEERNTKEDGMVANDHAVPICPRSIKALPDRGSEQEKRKQEAEEREDSGWKPSESDGSVTPFTLDQIPEAQPNEKKRNNDEEQGNGLRLDCEQTMWIPPH